MGRADLWHVYRAEGRSSRALNVRNVRAAAPRSYPESGHKPQSRGRERLLGDPCPLRVKADMTACPLYPQ